MVIVYDLVGRTLTFMSVLRQNSDGQTLKTSAVQFTLTLTSIRRDTIDASDVDDYVTQPMHVRR